LTPASHAGRFRRLYRDQRKGDTKRPTDKQLDSLGIFLLITGVVIGMGVAWIGVLPKGLSISMIVLALILVAAGLFLSKKYHTKDDL
jgi:hypothetical protein